MVTLDIAPNKDLAPFAEYDQIASIIARDLLDPSPKDGILASLQLDPDLLSYKVNYSNPEKTERIGSRSLRDHVDASIQLFGGVDATLTESRVVSLRTLRYLSSAVAEQIYCQPTDVSDGELKGTK